MGWKLKMWYRITFQYLLLIGITACKIESQTVNDESSTLESEIFDIKTELALGESFILPSVSGCNFVEVEEAFGLLVEQPSARQKNQISEILNFSGLPSNFQVLKSKKEISNAFAASFQNQRLIVFDEKLLNNVEQGSTEYWSSMSILAHEIGHHLAGHTLSGEGSSHQTEQEADRFSGFVLFKMGASLEEAKYALNKIGTETDTRSHPSKEKRLRYIEEGWKEAERQRAFAVLPPAPYDDGQIFPVYSPDQILGFDQYNYLYILGTQAYGLIENVEGIIIKSWVGNPYFHYDVFLTSLSEKHEHLLINEIFTFGMVNPIEAYQALHKLDRDFLTKQVMVPGRKIKFTLNTEGNQGNYSITRVEVIPRED